MIPAKDYVMTNNTIPAASVRTVVTVLNGPDPIAVDAATIKR